MEPYYWVRGLKLQWNTAFMLNMEINFGRSETGQDCLKF